jgi:hypothetical protein
LKRIEEAAVVEAEDNNDDVVAVESVRQLPPRQLGNGLIVGIKTWDGVGTTESSEETLEGRNKSLEDEDVVSLEEWFLQAVVVPMITLIQC